MASLAEKHVVANPVSEAVPSAVSGAVRGGEPELQNFDLRDALAGMTVRETSFKEFLAALKKFGPNKH